MNLLVTALGAPQPAESGQERAAADALAAFRASGFGYFLEQATRPQTIGYALLDSPIALAAWMIDHDFWSYEDISRAADVARQAGDKGAKAKAPLMITPGSEMIFQTIKRDGQMAILEKVNPKRLTGGANTPH